MGKGKSKRSKGKIGKADSQLLPFHGVSTNALVGGQFTFPVSPNGLSSIVSRVQIEADGWAFFRLRSFKARIHRISTIASIQTVGYVGGVQDVLPGSTSEVGSLLPSTVLAANATLPTEWIVPSKLEMAGPFEWYKSLPGMADPTEEAPGVLVICGATTEAFCVEIRGVIEFKTAVSTVNTPEILGLRNMLRDLERKERLRRQKESLAPQATAVSQPVVTSSRIWQMPSA